MYNEICFKLLYKIDDPGAAVDEFPIVQEAPPVLLMQYELRDV